MSYKCPKYNQNHHITANNAESKEGIDGIIVGWILLVIFTCFAITFIETNSQLEKNLVEDKDMTQAFVENHQKELALIDSFYQTSFDEENFNMAVLHYSDKNKKFYEEDIRLVFYPNSPYCSMPIDFSNNKLLFSKEYVVQYGKEEVFKRAENCLTFIYNNQISRLKQQEETKSFEQSRLNQKFVLQNK